MARLKDTEINIDTIKRYIEENSDFSFEMKVLRKLSQLNFECEHSGTYEDPVTKKSREFDIRATKEVYENCNISLAVECKNLRANFPLVIHCVERSEAEAKHELFIIPGIIETRPQEGIPFSFRSPSLGPSRGTDRLKLNNQISTYKSGCFVGKSMDQVGVAPNDEIKAGDGLVFEKMSQAINSAFELIDNAHRSDRFETTEDIFHGVIPLLVVPNDMLWEIRYNMDGSTSGEPRQVNHISYLINQYWRVGYETNWMWYLMSHIDIVTIAGLEAFMEDHFNPMRTTSYFGTSNRSLSDLHYKNE